MAKATTMGPMKIKESASYRVFKVFNAIILTLISVAMLYPFLYLVAQSFSSTQAIVAGEVGLIPKDFNISTYKYVITDGTYSLTPGYYCKGLSIGQTSDDQIDLREELGYACGNFMYSGNTELLTSNFTDDLRDFYDRQGQYRKLRPLDPTVTFDEDQMEMLNLWGTPMTDTVNAWTCKFAMNQADINNDWDTYVAEVEAQNMQNIVDMYNDTYNASK